MAKNKKNLYNEDSIQSLSPLEFTRLRPQVYAGDCTYATQLLVEIISNAVDEWSIGHGNEIDVTINGSMVTVTDNGQGFIPNSFREDGKSILEAAFSVLNTSGKFDDDGVYEGNVLGTYGIGAKITNFLSHALSVSTCRDGVCEEVQFEEGVFKNRRITKIDAKQHGTSVQWVASEEFFSHPEVEINKIKDLFSTLVCLCPGLSIVLHEGENVTLYRSKNGLNYLVDREVKGKEILDDVDRLTIDFENKKNKMSMVMTYTSQYSSTIIPYVNTGLTDSGPHITQIKTVFTREFNKFFKEKGWLKAGESNLTGDEIQEGMFVIFNITAPGVAYDAQIKSRITKIDMTPFTSVLAEELQTWFLYHEKEVKGIFDKATTAKKAKEAAKKAKDAVRNVGQKKEKKKKILNLPTKLVDCWGKDRSKCELLIAEGDSAANGLVKARDAEIQAIFPIRGKILAVYKAKLDKILANQEIVNIIKALGLDMNKEGKLVYDPKNLRYGRIMLCADADPDGQNIKNLLLELFWYLCPELVINGHIYTTTPPLFRITKGTKYEYLKDQVALDEYITKHKGEKYLVNRNKGLGEQDADELYDALINPETRNISQIIVDDREYADWLMECLCGPSVPPRRSYLLKHSEEAKGEND